ncbi:MAG: hypothetical protein JJT99_11915, partial [Rhodobacteraceae bacterium]|nr:hypothetical protein [Paracoccaceae bacterium]
MTKKPVFKRSTVIGLGSMVIFQIACATFFILELATDVLGLRHWVISPFLTGCISRIHAAIL